MRARTVEDVILGEAASGTPEQRYRDMLAIASVISNRANQLGVSVDNVIANQREFNAYNRSLPAGASAYRSMARQALDEVQRTGPVTTATFYATPSAVGNLPGGLNQVHRTAGHVYYEDPQARAIGTALGYRSPNVQQASPFDAILAPTPTSAPRTPQTAPVTPVERAALPDIPQPTGFLGSTMDRAAQQRNRDRQIEINRSAVVSPDMNPALGGFDWSRMASPTNPDSALLSFDPNRFGSVGQPAMTPQALQRGLLDQQLDYGILPNIPPQAAPAFAGAQPQPQVQQPRTGYVDPMVRTAPQTAVQVQQPQTQQMANPGVSQMRTGSVGLTSQQMQNAARNTQNMRVQNAIGTLGGAVLGGALLGPVGGLLGGFLGREVARDNYYPAAPEPISSETKGSSYNDLSGYGRDVYDSSGQFQDAVNSGRGGLW